MISWCAEHIGKLFLKGGVDFTGGQRSVNPVQDKATRARNS